MRGSSLLLPNLLVLFFPIQTPGKQFQTDPPEQGLMDKALAIR